MQILTLFVGNNIVVVSCTTILSNLRLLSKMADQILFKGSRNYNSTVNNYILNKTSLAILEMPLKGQSEVFSNTEVSLETRAFSEE